MWPCIAAEDSSWELFYRGFAEQLAAFTQRWQQEHTYSVAISAVRVKCCTAFAYSEY